MTTYQDELRYRKIFGYDPVNSRSNPTDWAADTKKTNDNRKKAMTFGKALGLSEDIINQLIKYNVSRNRNVIFDDGNLKNCVIAMVKEFWDNDD
jgi:hypothetical protein